MAVKYLNQHFFKDNEHIHTFFCSANRNEQMHFHEFWELSYVYEGFCKNRTHSQVENVSADDFLLISPGMEHSFSSLPKKAQTRLCNCLITKKYFDAVFKQYSEIHGIMEYEFYKLLKSGQPFCLHLSDNNINIIKHIVWLIAHEYTHFTTGSHEVITNSMISLLVSISRLYEKQINNCNSAAFYRVHFIEL